MTGQKNEVDEPGKTSGLAMKNKWIGQEDEFDRPGKEATNSGMVKDDEMAVSGLPSGEIPAAGTCQAAAAACGATSAAAP